MIKPLTSLRFIFALMVFAHHLGFLGKSESDVTRWIYGNILHEGSIGVSFFFILSGFILAFNYQKRLLNKELPVKKFFTARFARIYPLHFLTFIVAIPLTLQLFSTDKVSWIGQAISNITLTQSFVPLKEFYWSFNSPSWSISDEMFFYLLFPLLILSIPRLSKHKFLTIAIVIGIVPALSFLIPEAYQLQFFYINPLFRIIDFIIGIILFNAYVYVAEKKTSVNPNLIELSALLLLIVFMVFHQRIPLVARYSFYYWIPMSFMILVFAFQKGFISRLLSNKIIMHLGEISFGFYLFHQLVIRYVHSINNKFFHIDNEYIIALIMLIITLIVSHYSYVLYEIPMNKFVKKTIQNRRTLFSSLSKN